MIRSIRRENGRLCTKKHRTGLGTHALESYAPVFNNVYSSCSCIQVCVREPRATLVRSCGRAARTCRCWVSVYRDDCCCGCGCCGTVCVAHSLYPATIGSILNARCLGGAVPVISLPKGEHAEHTRLCGEETDRAIGVREV